MVKIRIDIVNDLDEDEVIIRCRRVDETIEKIQHYALEQSLGKSKITFYKKNQQFYFQLEQEITLLIL